ncbi:cytochrome P450 [Coniochaeta sp. 2T2.1]|nr:cytochrome P450 [Coniochaeta sp. 2T2.1]
MESSIRRAAVDAARERAWPAIGLLAAVLVTTFLWKLYQARSFMRQLQRQGKPMPPHHWLLGHLPIAARVFRSLPPHAHLLLIADQIRRLHPELDTAFYLDVWPFGPPALMVVSPEIVSQFTQEGNLPKYKGVRRFLKPLTGKKDLVTMEGHEWKHWRNNFNPGFRASNIMDMVPTMIEEVRTYRDIIHQHAKTGDMFPLELPTLAMSMDIIGRVVMDEKFNSQREYNPLCEGLIDQLAWCDAGLHANPLGYVNVARPFVQRYNAWRMNSYVDPLLEQRYETVHQRKGSKFIVDLIMGAYVKENNVDKPPPKIDSEFSEFMRAQVKLFLQAGHDTTAASIVFTLHLLSKHPDTLRRLRSELDAVFGSPDPPSTCDVLSKKPHLLNQCDFLLAVVKETLRIYPPTATARSGLPGFDLTDPSNGNAPLPTEGCLVVGNHFGIHHNPRFWPRADEFVPDRWLVAEGHELYPVRNGWRPFERGPRNCLGQELAMTEIRLVVAIMCREFDFREAYGESDRARGLETERLRVNGERCYQIIRGGGHPSDNYPCRVHLVGKADGKTA